MNQATEKSVTTAPREELWIQRHTDLAEEFSRYCLEHPEILKQMPDDSVLCMQVESDEEFNSWVRSWIKESARGSPITCVMVKKLRSARSLIEEVEIKSA